MFVRSAGEVIHELFAISYRSQMLVDPLKAMSCGPAPGAAVSLGTAGVFEVFNVGFH